MQTEMSARLRHLRRLFAEDWTSLSWYQRFESLVAFALTLVVSMVIGVALYRLIVGVVVGLLLGVLNPLDHSVFQAVFGQIITLLIALEFNHTLQYFATRVQSLIQIKVVLLIALLAMTRKFIILDMHDTSATELLSLAAATLALGMTYGLIKEGREPRE